MGSHQDLVKGRAFVTLSMKGRNFMTRSIYSNTFSLNTTIIKFPL
jgi:hypothetical protein